MQTHQGIPLLANSSLDGQSQGDDASSAGEVAQLTPYSDLHTALRRSFGDPANVSNNFSAADQEPDSQSVTTVRDEAQQSDSTGGMADRDQADSTTVTSANGTSQALPDSTVTLAVPEGDRPLDDDNFNHDPGLPPLHRLGGGDGTGEDPDYDDDLTLAALSEIRDTEALIKVPALPGNVPVSGHSPPFQSLANQNVSTSARSAICR